MSENSITIKCSKCKSVLDIFVLKDREIYVNSCEYCTADLESDAFQRGEDKGVDIGRGY